MRVSIAIAALTIAAASTVGHAQQSIPFDGERLVRVMTRNADHGVIKQIWDVPNATSLSDLLDKVAAVYEGYFATDFAERAEALAAEIQTIRPELIGVQEAVLVRTQFPPDGAATPAQTVALDYVQILLDALAARGLRYEVAVQQDGFDFELPSALGFDVRHTDRELILARSDLSTADLKLWNAQGGNFEVNCTVPGALFGPVTIRRSWVSVDAKIRGASFRMLSTHLDGDCLPFTPAFQRAQAQELLTGPATTNLPILVVGDLNSPADGTGVTYNDFLAAGFSDAWSAGGSGAGLTCCQQDDLRNVTSTLDRRIDFVLLRGAVTTLAAVVTGDDAAERTSSGLWPSDHAGVSVVVKLLK